MRSRGQMRPPAMRTPPRARRSRSASSPPAACTRRPSRAPTRRPRPRPADGGPGGPAAGRRGDERAGARHQLARRRTRARHREHAGRARRPPPLRSGGEPARNGRDAGHRRHDVRAARRAQERAFARAGLPGQRRLADPDSARAGRGGGDPARRRAPPRRHRRRPAARRLGAAPRRRRARGARSRGRIAAALLPRRRGRRAS